MTLGGMIRHFAACPLALNRLRQHGGCLKRPLVVEHLEERVCPVLALTQAGLSAGFGLSVFATGFPVSSGVGAMSVLFRAQGGELVSDFNGDVRLLSNDNDGQIVTTIPPSQTYSGAPMALAQLGTNLYMTEFLSSGKLVQINANGDYVRDIVTALPYAAGMVGDPQTDQLFVAAGSVIYNVALQTSNVAQFETVGACEGLALSADGHTLYAALWANNQVVGYDVATGNVVFGPITITGNPTGLALGAGRFDGHLYVSTLTGTLFDVDLATGTSTMIASGGERGDFLTFDPNDGSLLVTQTDQIERLSFPPGPATSFRIDAPATFLAGQPFSLTVTALDADGYQATGYTGTVSFTSTHPSAGLLPSDYTFTSTDNGTHNFGTVLFTAGAQTLTVQDTANPSFAGSAPVTVDPAPASHISLTSPPTAIAGSPFDLTVTALDPYGNTAPNYTGTVTFTTTDPAAGVVLPATYTFTSTDAGSHTFVGGGTLVSAGSQTITVTDAANVSFAASVPVQVIAAPASHFVMTPPPTAVAGTLFDILLTALDPYGNVATNYIGTVAFASTDMSAGVMLPSAYTFTNTDAGVHRFSGQAALIKAGSQTITATDIANAALSGRQVVTVTPAAASYLMLEAPTTAVTGVPFDVTVTAFDLYGNVDTNYLGTVTLTTTDSNPGVILPANYTFQVADGGIHTFTAGVTLITPGLQAVAATDTANGAITGGAAVTVSAPPVPPPGGGATGPRTPRTNGVGRTVQQVILLDRVFSLLSVKNRPFTIAHAVDKALVDDLLGSDDGLLGSTRAGQLDVVPLAIK